VQPRALVPGGHPGQPVRRFKSELLHKLDYHCSKISC
jgi:hypothetical protein